MTTKTAKIERYEAGDGSRVLLSFRWTSVEGVRGVVWAWKMEDAPDVDPNTHETNWSDESGPEPSIAAAREWAHDCLDGWDKSWSE